jgi:predicted phage terminase large subunit-like protein
MQQIILGPGSLPQEQFLLSTSDITLYSGSAGAGKSFAIILNMLKFLLKKNSTIVCFRRTTTELRSAGGLWREASGVFRAFFGDRAVVKDRDMEVYVPSTNSMLKMSHLQYTSDVEKHLSAQYSAIFFDEATTFAPFEDFILPLIGRLRNANVDYNPQMFWATNPKFDHGIYHWIKDFYLDQEGIPVAENSNVERYLVMQNSKPIWYSTLAEAESVHGIGAGKGIRSFRSIRASVYDNRKLLDAQPDYISNLKSLPEIKRRIYLDGSWTAREEEAGLYQRAWSKEVPFPNLKAKRRVRAWDLASMPVSSQSPNPDWTRGTLMSKDDLGVYTIEDAVGIRDRPHVVEQLILSTAIKDRAMFGDVQVVYPIDPGQAGTARAADIKRQLAELGISCKTIRPHTAKRVRFLPFSAIAEAGFVQVVKGDWNEEFYVELEEFTGLRRRERDDYCDTVSDCIQALNTGVSLPTGFSLPDLSLASTKQHFGFQSSQIPSDLVVKLN